MSSWVNKKGYSLRGVFVEKEEDVRNVKAYLALVQDIANSTKRRFSDSSIIHDLINKDKQLWEVRYANDTAGVVLTEVNTYPMRKLCCVWGLAGKGVEDWLNLMVYIENWAKSHGCDGMEFYGRRGWTKYLGDYGYSHSGIEMIKEF